MVGIELKILLGPNLNVSASTVMKSKKDIFLNRLNKKGWLNEEKCFVNNFGRGQEYILDAEKYPRIIDWAHYLISNHG